MWGSEFSWRLRRVRVGRSGYLLDDIWWVSRIRDDGVLEGKCGEWEGKSRRGRGTGGGRMEVRVEDRDMSRERATCSVGKSD